MMAVRRSLAVIIVAILAGGSFVIVAHYDYPKTYRIELKMYEWCPGMPTTIVGTTRVAGHNWIHNGGPSAAVNGEPGRFTVVSPHHARFVADHGGEVDFYLLPAGPHGHSCPL